MALYDLEPVEEGVVFPEKKASGLIDRAVLNGPETVGVPEAVAEKAPEVAKENSYEKVLERAQPQTQSQGVAQIQALTDDVHAVVSVDEESRIQKLVNIALEKGPEHAFRVAVELDDMYALDMLHDRLSHQLYDELIAKGLLKSL